MIKKNPLVFLDVSIDGDPAERMVFELFCDAAPKTAENFRALCTGEKGTSPNTGSTLHYKGSFFHRIVKGLLAQGGDFLNRDGTFGESIYGKKFPDEPVSKLKHDERGLLTMAVADQDVRGSLFSITFKPFHQLDGKNVVFGKLVQGDEVLEKIDNAGDENGWPLYAVKIINCGDFYKEKKRERKLKRGKGSRELNRKGKRKKSSRHRRKRRRKYYSSELETSLDSETESSESDSDSESSYLSSSSDDKRKKRKRYLKSGRNKRGKKRRKHEKKHRKRGKKSKRRSESFTDTVSQSESSNDAEVNGTNQNHNPQPVIIAQNQPPLAKEPASVSPDKGMTTDILEKEVEYPKENGDHRINEINLETNAGTTANRPALSDDHPRKSNRSQSISPKRSLSKSMSISQEKSMSPRQSLHRSPSFDKSPQLTSRKSRSICRSPASSLSRSPVKRSLSRSPVKRSLSRSPVKRSISRSPVRPYRRSISRSPVRVRTRRSYSRSLSKSPREGSPNKRIRRGRGFSQQYSYARKYRTPSPVRSHHYGRNVRERYVRSSRYNRSPPRERSPLRKSPRRYRSPPSRRSPPRRSPRRFRSPPRERTPLRYKSRRSRTRSPSPYQTERRTPPTPPTPRTPPSRSRSPSSPGLPSPPNRANGKDRSRSSSFSRSPPGSNYNNNNRGGLVSYDDGSPDVN